MSTKQVTRMVTHVKSTRDPAKGRCGKRAGKHSRVTTILAVVDCPECRPTLMSNQTHVAAMRKMAGVN
jgi:hypothetical protein